MSKKNKLQLKSAFSPESAHVRAKEFPSVGSADYQSPTWQLHRRDGDHDLWGWNKLTLEERVKIEKMLESFEQMSWTEIKQQSGGKAVGNGTNHHALPIGKFSKAAQKRLQELKLDDYDELFSLRLGNKLRLYGIKDGRVLRLIWYDPYHGESNGAYPTKQR